MAYIAVKVHIYNTTPGLIHPDDVKDQLGDVDAEYSNGLCHGTCLLWVNGGRRYRHHSG